MVVDKDETVVSVNLSKQDLDTLVEAMRVYSVKQGNKIKSPKEYEAKRSTLNDYKELIQYLKRQRNKSVHPILDRLIAESKCKSCNR